MGKPPFLIRITAFIALCVYLIGCASTAETPVLTVARMTSTMSPVPSKTVPPIVTRTNTPSATNTPILPTPTYTSIPTITPTSLPTLTKEERLAYTNDLFRTNAGCKLPCWWGIVPGETTWQETETFLQHLGAASRPQDLEDGITYHSSGGFYFDLYDYIIVNKIGFLERNDIVELILVHSDGYSNPIAFQEQWASFSPKRIMEDYGVPSRVLVSSSSSGYVTENRKAGYRLWLFYDQFGFVIMYSGSGEFGDTFHFCPSFENGQDIRSLVIYMQSPENTNPVEKPAESMGFEIQYPRVQTIEQAAGITPIEFYNLFFNNEQACFETPRDIWP